MKPVRNTKAKVNAKVASGNKPTLKRVTKQSAVVSPRLAANHNETLLTR